MIQIKSLDKLKEEIDTQSPIIIYFSSLNCSVCNILKPKIEEELKSKFPKIKFFEIKSDESADITSYFSVFSAPTILFYIDKKEFFREGRNISINAFSNSIKRAYEMFYGE